MDSATLATVTTLRPTRTRADNGLDLPPCGNTWGPTDCHRPGGPPGPHRCWTWTGWPHICRCLRCNGGAR